MNIRQATVRDVKGIHSLIKQHAQHGELLPRPLSEVYEKVQDFIVAEERGCVMACGALHVAWEDLAEVRSLIVSKELQGKGIGSKVVRELEKRAALLGIKKVFALSFKPGFFTSLGYKEIERDTLPHKIWQSCVNCPLFPDCGETALIKRIKGKSGTVPNYKFNTICGNRSRRILPIQA